MFARGIIVNTTPHVRPAMYQFNLKGDLLQRLNCFLFTQKVSLLPLLTDLKALA